MGLTLRERLAEKRRAERDPTLTEVFFGDRKPIEPMPKAIPDKPRTMAQAAKSRTPKRKADPLQPRRCEWCGEPFQPLAHNGRYCSDKCRRRVNHKKYRENHFSARGYLCSCGGSMGAADTRPSPNGIRRRRVCPECGRKIWTIEQEVPPIA